MGNVLASFHEVVNDTLTIAAVLPKACLILLTTGQYIVRTCMDDAFVRFHLSPSLLGNHIHSKVVASSIPNRAFFSASSLIQQLPWRLNATNRSTMVSFAFA